MADALSDSGDYGITKSLINVVSFQLGIFTYQNIRIAPQNARDSCTLLLKREFNLGMITRLEWLPISIIIFWPLNAFALPQ